LLAGKPGRMPQVIIVRSRSGESTSQCDIMIVGDSGVDGS
jgi:hypothetical protein